MDKAKYSGPTNPFKKPNGKWTVEHFPNGFRTEYGEYPDLHAAQKAFEVLAASWLANDPVYVKPSDDLC
jgi:hypothetical protein